MIPEADKRPWSELTMTERRLRRQARRERREAEEAKAAEEAAKAPKPAALTETRQVNERRGLMRRLSNAGKSAQSAPSAAGQGAVTTEALRATDDPEPASEIAADAADIVPEPSIDPIDTASNVISPPREAVDEVAEPTPAPAPQSATAGESVAAKLARIRAVVGGRDAKPAASSQDTTAADDAPVESDEVVEDLEATISEEEKWTEAQVPLRETADTEDEAETAPEPDLDEEVDEGVAEDEVPNPSRVRARVVRMRRSDYDAQTAGADEAPELDADVSEDALEALAEAEELEDLAALDAPALDKDAIDSGLEGEPSTLSPEDEAELLEELAEVERLSNEGADEEAEDAPTPSGRAALLARSPDADSDGVDRILTETDAQLKEPEGNRRREAIAHLKAAVAATEAARQLGEDDGLDDGENMFREDLDQVVRPRRTSRPESRSDRPRPAP